MNSLRAGISARRVLPLLAALALALLLPLTSLVATSLDVAPFGSPAVFGLGNWAAMLRQPAMLDALLNTLALGIALQVLSLILGAGISWLIARTDLPGQGWLEVGFWIGLFMPPLPAALAWVMLLDGSSGLINRALYLLPFVHAPVFRIYSFWGIIWVHLMGAALALKVFLLVPIFRNLDSSLEEAARASGASLWRTMAQVVVPLIGPALAVTGLIGLVRAMQSFEVELVLGAPAGIDVYSTVIYRAMGQEPPLDGLASAMAVSFVLALVPLVLMQHWYSRRHAYGSVGGRMRTRVHALGAAKWPAFAFVAAVMIVMTAVPLACLLLSTFMQLFGVFDMREPWTLDHWRHALGRGDTLQALWNTLRLGVSSALWGMAVYTTLAYVTVRTRGRASHLIDLVTWAPALIPGVVLSLGLLQVFTGVGPLRALYGSIASMVIAVLIGSVTTGVQFLKTSLVQIGREMEEAGWTSGGSRLYVVWRIVVPLIARSIAVVGLEVFAAANAAVGVIALLGVGQTQPLSILQLNLLTSGQLEAASVVGFVIMSLTIGSALLARWIAERARPEAAP